MLHQIFAVDLFIVCDLLGSLPVADALELDLVKDGFFILVGLILARCSEAEDTALLSYLIEVERPIEK